MRRRGGVFTGPPLVVLDINRRENGDAEAPSEAASRPAGEWKRLEVAFIGDHITVELNGKQVIDWKAEPRGKVEDFAYRGYIGLQNHDDRTRVTSATSTSRTCRARLRVSCRRDLQTAWIEGGGTPFRR